jgi:hypothetical protein
MTESTIQALRRAWPVHQGEAEEALAMFRTYTASLLPRVPGMDTVLRLALRLYYGATIEQAAAREYLYRWHLALIPSPSCAGVFGVPHTLGM